MSLRGRYRELVDYYKQFEAVPEDEVNEQLREEQAQRKALELATVETLDLSQTTRAEPPDGDVVAAIAFVARRGVHRYPGTTELAGELAHRLDVAPDRVAIDNGACELMRATAAALLRPEQALLTPWPSYPLFPQLASACECTAVPVRGGVDALLSEAGRHDTRVIALASPNDPTGQLLTRAELERLLSRLPDTVAVLLDEALIEYAGPEAQRVSLALLEAHPRLLVFRSFSKAWGLAGLRCGYAICADGAQELLRTIVPPHGVSELTQAAALESLRSCERAMRRRVREVAAQRERLTSELRRAGLQVADSAASFLWVAHPSIGGGELAARLRESGILVAPGAPLGAPEHVRISVRDEAASQRVLSAIAAVDTARRQALRRVTP